MFTVILVICLSASDQDVEHPVHRMEVTNTISCEHLADDISLTTDRYAYCEIQFNSEE